MAAINKLMFANAQAADKAPNGLLEEVLNKKFLFKEAALLITESNKFGKAVAAAVYNRAEADGYKNANDLYAVPASAGWWKPTPPAFVYPLTPYWGSNRSIIIRSIGGTQPWYP